VNIDEKVCNSELKTEKVGKKNAKSHESITIAHSSFLAFFSFPFAHYPFFCVRFCLQYNSFLGCGVCVFKSYSLDSMLLSKSLSLYLIKKT
jgi:hypothetical protein